MTSRLAQVAGIAVALFASLDSVEATPGQWSALGLSGRYVQRLRAEDGLLYACTHDGLYRKASSSPETTWVLLGFSGQRINDVLVLSPMDIVACKRLSGPNDSTSLYRTTNSGATWNPYQNGYGRGRYPEVKSLFALPGMPQAWLATGSGIEKSTDGGQSWRLVAEQCVVRFAEVAPHSNPVVWSGGETCIFSAVMFRSTDLGETWQSSDLSFEGGGDNSCYGTAFDPTNPAVVFVGGEGRVFQTTDGGNTWRNVTSPNPSYYIFGMANRTFPPLRLYAGGAGFPPQDVVLYRSDDAGLTWTSITHQADAHYGVTGLLVDSQPAADRIYVATANGVYRYVETELLDVPPGGGGSRFANCPDPFGAHTRLDFALSRRSHVRLEILGVDGRRVATLVEGERNAGPHTLDWDASGLPSGLYLAVLRTVEHTRILRLVRVR